MVSHIESITRKNVREFNSRSRNVWIVCWMVNGSWFIQHSSSATLIDQFSSRKEFLCRVQNFFMHSPIHSRGDECRRVASTNTSEWRGWGLQSSEDLKNERKCLYSIYAMESLERIIAQFIKIIIFLQSDVMKCLKISHINFSPFPFILSFALLFDRSTPKTLIFIILYRKRRWWITIKSFK